MCYQISRERGWDDVLQVSVYSQVPQANSSTAKVSLLCIQYLPGLVIGLNTHSDLDIAPYMQYGLSHIMFF